MKKILSVYYLSVVISTLSFLFISCSILEDNLTSVSSLGIHKKGVLDTQSNDFHGKLVGTNGSGFGLCQQCHANDFSGGTTKVDCIICHTSIQVHKEGIITQGSQDFHGKFISENGWDLTLCSSCHGGEYGGGLSSPSCNTCHTEVGGPEACNTCHGDFSDVSQIAPPQDLQGNTDTNLPGVGAHQIHLSVTETSASGSCNNCHIIPSNYNSPNHIDLQGNAEINFNDLAASKSGFGSVYNFSENTCSNIYCHGSFEIIKDSSDYGFIFTADKITGNNVSVKWNQVDGTQAQCGSCHGLPPIGHLNAAINECVFCHYGVVDAEGKIIDNTKHINGISNVYGN